MMSESSPEFVGADLHFGSEGTAFQRLLVVQLCSVERLFASQHVKIDRIASNIGRGDLNRYRRCNLQQTLTARL